MKHFDFDRISIQEMSKDDMLLIIEALEYTGKSTNICLLYTSDAADE